VKFSLKVTELRAIFLLFALEVWISLAEKMGLYYSGGGTVVEIDVGTFFFFVSLRNTVLDWLIPAGLNTRSPNPNQPDSSLTTLVPRLLWSQLDEMIFTRDDCLTPTSVAKSRFYTVLHWQQLKISPTLEAGNDDFKIDPAAPPGWVFSPGDSIIGSLCVRHRSGIWRGLLCTWTLRCAFWILEVAEWWREMNKRSQ
jgi:hypothetical protein